MSQRAYFFNAGQYVFHVDGEPTTAPTDTIALCLKKTDGGVLKHGKPDAVRQWHATTVKKMSDAGLTEWADDLVVVEGRFPLEEINRCLDNGNYSVHFLEKLYNGEIAGIGYGPADAINPPDSPSA